MRNQQNGCDQAVLSKLLLCTSCDHKLTPRRSCLLNSVQVQGEAYLTTIHLQLAKVSLRQSVKLGPRHTNDRTAMPARAVITAMHQPQCCLPKTGCSPTQPNLYFNSLPFLTGCCPSERTAGIVGHPVPSRRLLSCLALVCRLT